MVHKSLTRIVTTLMLGATLLAGPSGCEFEFDNSAHCFLTNDPNRWGGALTGGEYASWCGCDDNFFRVNLYDGTGCSSKEDCPGSEFDESCVPEGQCTPCGNEVIKNNGFQFEVKRNLGCGDPNPAYLPECSALYDLGGDEK
jgi:hypothetical protein